MVTMTNFIILITILSSISSLFTEAVKKTFEKANSAIVAAICSFIVGWIGGASAFYLIGLEFSLHNIICLIFMGPTIWLIATLGYDKVKEVMEQFYDIK